MVLGFPTVNLVRGQTPTGDQEKASPSQSQSAQTAVSSSPSQTAIQQAQASVEASKGQNQNQQGNGDQSTFTDWIQVGINAALLVIIVLQTAIYWRQSKIMQAQVDHARIAERAYLGVNTMGLSDLVIGERPKVTAIVNNGGRTPAFKVRAPGKIDLQPAGKRSQPEVIKSTFAPDDNSIVAAGASRLSVYEFTIPCDALMKHRIESGEIAVFVQGTIWYEDVWGNEHHSGFFFEWNPVQMAFMDRRERQHGEAAQQISD